MPATPGPSYYDSLATPLMAERHLCRKNDEAVTLHPTLKRTFPDTDDPGRMPATPGPSYYDSLATPLMAERHLCRFYQKRITAT